MGWWKANREKFTGKVNENDSVEANKPKSTDEIETDNHQNKQLSISNVLQYLDDIKEFANINGGN